MKADYLRTLFLWPLIFLATPVWSLDIAATIDWSNRIELGSPTASGLIETVLVKPGQRVEQGDLLVEFDHQTAALKVTEAEVMVKAAGSRLGEAKREYARALELYERTVLSDRDKYLAEIGMLEAQQSLAKAQAILQGRKRDMVYRRVVAPFSGMVLRVDAKPGMAVTNRLSIQSLVTLVDDQQLLAQGQLDTKSLSQLVVGQPVQVAVREQWVKARVDAIGLDPVAVTDQGPRYKVTAAFQLPEGLQIRAGEITVIRTEAE